MNNKDHLVGRLTRGQWPFEQCSKKLQIWWRGASLRCKYTKQGIVPQSPAGISFIVLRLNSSTFWLGLAAGGCWCPSALPACPWHLRGPAIWTPVLTSWGRIIQQSFVIQNKRMGGTAGRWAPQTRQNVASTFTWQTWSLKQLYGHNHININQVIDAEQVIGGLLGFIDTGFYSFQILLAVQELTFN